MVRIGCGSRTDPWPGMARRGPPVSTSTPGGGAAGAARKCHGPPYQPAKFSKPITKSIPCVESIRHIVENV